MLSFVLTDFMLKEHLVAVACPASHVCTLKCGLVTLIHMRSFNLTQDQCQTRLYVSCSFSEENKKAAIFLIAPIVSVSHFLI